MICFVHHLSPGSIFYELILLIRVLFRAILVKVIVFFFVHFVIFKVLLFFTALLLIFVSSI